MSNSREEIAVHNIGGALAEHFGGTIELNRQPYRR
jgi:hypothetical protein